MTAAGWLLVAAVALILVARWCASGYAAMVRVNPDGLETYGGLLTLIQVGAEVAATVLVTLAFAHWLGGGWQVFLPAAGALLLARYVLIGVGPRAMGKDRAEQVAGTAARLTGGLYRALGPLPGLLGKVTAVLPVGRRGADPEFGGRPEVRSLVDYIEGQTEIEPGERDMVRSVFELGDTIVREVMVPRTDMVFIERDKTLDQALSLALRSGFSRVPVVGESTDDVVGIAYLKDIVAWEHEHPDGGETERIEKVMRPATYVPDSKPVDELLRQMQSMRIHVAIVIDEYGGTAGMVTIEDILEEIVGEIADEYDNERAPVEWLAPGTARVIARLPVTELEELFGVTVDAEDVETVGGLLAHELGRVPIAGAEATVAGLRLTAENLAGRRNKLGTVLVERVAADSELSERTVPSPRSSATVEIVADDVDSVLDQFTRDAGQVLPLTALWAHGSLALGDFVPGRSDLDLVALVAAPVTAAQRLDLQRIHERLIAEEPLAAELHCSYIVDGDQDDPERDHLTWAHQELFERRVSPVSRRELLQGGRRLLGPAPATVLPVVTDAELAGYIRRDLRDYWYPHTARPDLWRADIWVDLGMLTLARATVTLRDGRLITKREALDVLGRLDAPADVVADIRTRRYGSAPAASADWLARRGELARTFVRTGIERTLSLHSSG
jgi:CBS domain containing-hemolysin-like protein